jgi:hypothetical protein
MKRRQLERVERRRPLIELNLIGEARPNPLATGRLRTVVRDWLDRAGRRSAGNSGTAPARRSPRPR